EEAARLFGYEKIRPILPESVHVPAIEDEELYWEGRAKEALRSLGYTESFVYEFAGDTELHLFDESLKGVLELENPVSPETKYLLPRPVLKYILQASDNIRNTNADIVRLFGVAKSFHVNGKKPEDPANERKTISVVLAEKGDSRGESFYELKGDVDNMLESFGISDHWYDDTLDSEDAKEATKLHHPFRRAEIKIGGERIGYIGEVHPMYCERIKSKARIVVAEIDSAVLSRCAESETEFSPIPKFPAIIRDIAVIVPEDVKTESVLNVIEEHGGENLIDTDLFDYFQDGKLEKNREKNLAFHLIFQSAAKTLTDGEVDTSISKIVKALEGKSWAVRK
ncbi:MAG: hypothetical protein HYW88_01125, partial [Candidatus Sungbacteria bacterium]|nr:hypothetical protein [Candidatus Sungbacteria bacterium]